MESQHPTQPRQVGIIGCGWAGARHAQAYQAFPERATLTAVADQDKAVAQQQAEAWNTPIRATDYRDLLANAGLDAVSICLPHSLHCEAAVAAAEAGVHVLVEKPLAASLAEADRMIAAARAHNICLMVAEVVRFHATYRRVRKLLQDNVLGPLSLIRIHREHQMHAYLQARPWFLQEPFGGILASGGIHDFELVRMLAGEIIHVYALTPDKIFEDMAADDTGVVVAGLANGAMATLVESFAIRTPTPGVHGVVNGAQGSLWFQGETIRLYRAETDGDAEAIETIHVPQVDPFEAEVGHFLDCLDTGARPLTHAEEQRRPLAAVLAAYASVDRGERVYLADERVP